MARSEGISRGAPAVRTTEQTSFALQSADADGVKTTFATTDEAQLFEGAALNGADITAGLLEGDRNITATLGNNTNGYVAGSAIVVTGEVPGYPGALHSESLTIASADGNATITGLKMFAAGKPFSVLFPAAGMAQATCTVAGPWDFAPAATFIADDGGGDETATFDAANAATASGAETYNLDDGMTLTYNDGINPLKTATFNTADFVDINAAQEAEVVAVLQADWTGTGAPTVANTTGDFSITSTGNPGTADTFTLGGTALAALGLTAGPHTGTGDVANINAVTAAEFKTVVEADTTFNVTINANGTVTVANASQAAAATFAVKATSTVEVIMGFDTLTHSVGSVTIGTGVARAISPPAAWLWCNEAGELHGVLRSGAKIEKFVVSTPGPVPLGFASLHESTTIDDLVAIPE